MRVPVVNVRRRPVYYNNKKVVQSQTKPKQYIPKKSIANIDELQNRIDDLNRLSEEIKMLSIKACMGQDIELEPFIEALRRKKNLKSIENAQPIIVAVGGAGELKKELIKPIINKKNYGGIIIVDTENKDVNQEKIIQDFLLKYNNKIEILEDNKKG